MKKTFLLTATALSLLVLQGCGSESKKPSPVVSSPVMPEPLENTINLPEMSDISIMPMVEITQDNARFIAQTAFNISASNLPSLSQFRTLRDTPLAQLAASVPAQNQKSDCDERRVRYRATTTPYNRVTKESLNIDNCKAADDKRLANRDKLSSDDKAKLSLRNIERMEATAWQSGPSLINSKNINQAQIRYDDLTLRRHARNRLVRGNSGSDSGLRSAVRGPLHSALLGGRIILAPINFGWAVQYSHNNGKWQPSNARLRLIGKNRSQLQISLKDGNLKLTLIKNEKRQEITTTLADLATNATAYRNTQLRKVQDANPTIDEDLIASLMQQPYFRNPVTNE